MEKIDPIFGTIAIVGVGLIGGSLGMAVKRYGLTDKVVGIGRSEQKLMRAKILGAIDDYSLDASEGVLDADLVIVCTPVRTIVPTVESFAEKLKDGAVVTDVGSTKREIVELCEILMPEGRFFIGGHPMAGSEQAGVEAAFPDMFRGATYVLTPTPDTSISALGSLTALIDAIGANLEIMSPEQHDGAVAIISHLPHAISSALLQAAMESERSSGKTFRLAAGSFRDLTRISDSSPEIWCDICNTNADYLTDAICSMQNHLEMFKEILASKDEAAIRSYFEQAQGIRQTQLRNTK